jgi:hypothetical protein
MPARLKRWGIVVVMVLIVAGIIILLCRQSVDPAPVSIKYVGSGRFSNSTSLYPVPTFSFTNHTSKSQLVMWNIMVRTGTNLIWDRSLSSSGRISLDPITSADVAVDFAPWMATNAWRMHGIACEHLRGPASFVAALRYLWFSRNYSAFSIRRLFGTNQHWYGKPQSFDSEDILASKSRQ